MKRQLFVRKGVSILSLIGLLCVGLFTFCAKENPTTPEKYVPTYSFSGFIIDGNTGKALGGAMVTYFTANGDSVVKKTGSDGGFDIPGIPYGNRSFFFKYASPTDTSVKYTTAAITIQGNDWEHFGYSGISANLTDSVIGGVKSVAGPVKLYPLTGSLSGTVITQLHDRAALNPIKNAVVKVTFDPTFNLDNQNDSAAAIGSNIEVGPSTFEALTDSTGKFTLTGLPVSGDGHEKVRIKVVSITSGGIDWEMPKVEVVVQNGETETTESKEADVLVELAANQLVPVGAIILEPINKITLKEIDNNFKLEVVNPEHTFEVTYSDELDTVSYAILSYNGDGVDRIVPAIVTVSGKKITVNPVTSLISGVNYSLDVYAYGKAGQEVISNLNTTVNGGGLADVVSSNVLTATKAPVLTFGVKTPITFTFADSITGVPNVKVTYGTSNANTVECLLTTSADGKTLTISPRTIWKQSTINVNVVLRNGTIVSFTTPLNIENSLAFVSSNVYDFNSNTPKSLVSLSSDIVFFTNKDLTTADVVLKEGIIVLPTTVSLGEGDLKKVVINPLNTLKPATTYTVQIVVGTAQGESYSYTYTFTTTAAQFYAVSDNVRLNNDPAMPKPDFAPNANIVIRMSKGVMNASASLTAATDQNATNGGVVAVKVTIKNDSIIIDPENILDETKYYTLKVTAQDSAGLITDNQAYVKDLKPRASVYVVASNTMTADGKAVMNAAKDISPWYKLSVAPVASKIRVALKVKLKGGVGYTNTIDAVVSVLGDTLVVNPVSDFKYDDTVAISITGEAIDGNYIGFTDTFAIMTKPAISLVASNVTTADFEGLTNVVESTELWYLLSRTPVASSIIATVDGKKPVVRVSGDTVFLKSPVNFEYDSVIKVTLKGLDITGIAFDFASTSATAATWPNWKAFTTRQALYPVASNTWDLTDSIAENFPVYGEMWVKYSQPLSTDLTKIVWSASTADNTLYGSRPTGVQPNASVRVSNDTLFVTPIQNRIALNYNSNVGFKVVVAGVNGVTSVNTDFKVNYEKSKLFVAATNTVYSNAKMNDTLGKTQTVWLVSSLPFTEVTGIRDLHDPAAIPADGFTAMPVENLEVKRTVRVSGDTIFFTPYKELALSSVNPTKYNITFDVKLANGLEGNTNELKMAWQIRKATNLYVKATNTQANGVMVDTMGTLQTVWIIPSAPIDSIDAVAAYDDGIAPADTTPDDNGAGVNLLEERIRLSAAGDTIFWTPVDTLKFGKNYGIKFNVTLKTGEKFTGNELAVVWKTKPGIKLVSTNDMSDAAHTVYRVFKCKGDSLVATFSKAVDTSKGFSVTNFGSAGKRVYTWNAAFTTVTIKDTSKLTPKTYVPVQNYSTSGSAQYHDIYFDVVTFDGEETRVYADTSYFGVRPALRIHTEDELVAIDASYLKDHDAAAIDSTDDGIDSVLPTANITITFNRAVDAAAIQAAARDKYFKLVKSTATTTNLDYTISFSNAGKTVTIDPVADSLVREGIYYIIADSIPDLTSGDVYVGVGSTASVTPIKVLKALTNKGFTIKAAPRVTSIAAIATVITLDTNVNNSSVNPINGKRIGASPVQTAYANNAIEVNSATSLSFRIQEAVWNATHAQYVDAYQYRIRKVAKTGVATDWFEVADTISDANWSTAWNSVDTNAAYADHRVTINPTTAKAVLTGTFISNLLAPDRDGSADDYRNGANLFNDSSKIEVQVRAVKDLYPTDGDVLDAGEFGTWSNIITFADNVAPCDSDFVALTNCDDSANGGVGVAGPGVVTLNNAGAAASYTITLTFPEDMDTATDPTLTMWYEVALGAPNATTAISQAGAWTSARTFAFTLTLAGGQNYTINAPYYSISVAGVKDASGVTIQSYGDNGTAADGVPLGTADDTDDQGPNNIQLLQAL